MSQRNDPCLRQLETASNRPYAIELNGLEKGKRQYIDRDYVFESVPGSVAGITHICTAGDDKLIREDDLCLTFTVDVPITLYVLYPDKLHELPAWLKAFRDTRLKITRADSELSTFRGIFTIFAREYAPGQVSLNGNIASRMYEDCVFSRLTADMAPHYCMYSVAVRPMV